MPLVFVKPRVDSGSCIGRGRTLDITISGESPLLAHCGTGGCGYRRFHTFVSDMEEARVSEIIANLRRMRDEGKSMFVTSSFQTHSIPLLHLVSRSGLDIPIYCLNTGYLFPETLKFRDELAERYGLDIRTIKSEVPMSQQKDANGNMLFASDPDRCCHINKVEPTQKLLREYDVWVNGVRADQNANRKTLKTYAEAGFGAMRYHPMLEWTGREVYAYISKHGLPSHPLDDAGYMSIGCEPCTRKVVPGDPRQARWFGMNKTECGLHTELVKK